MPVRKDHRAAVESCFSIGVHHQMAGRLPEAAAEYRRALELNPRHSPSLHNLGEALKSAGELAQAEHCFRTLVRLAPDAADSWLNLGVVLGMRGDLEAAVKALRTATTRDPNNCSAWAALSHLLKALGDEDGALAAMRRAAAGKSPAEPILTGLAQMLVARRDWDEAETVVNLAGRRFGEKSEIQILRAQICEGRGRIREAIDLLELAPMDGPGAIEAHFHRARLQLKTSDHAKGLALLEAFSRVCPSHAEAHGLLAAELLRSGRTEESLSHLDWQLAHANAPKLRVVHATALPIIAESAADIRWWRQRMSEQLDRCLDEDFVKQGLLPDDFSTTNFYLAYHDLPDIQLQAKTASLYRQACPALNYVAPHCRGSYKGPDGRRLRVGFLSEFMRNHTIGKLNRGYIANLDRRRFEVFDIFLGDAENSSAKALGTSADHYLPYGQHPIKDLQQRIAELELDAAFFTDIGMGSLSFRLAFSRLAPLQFATWGHPDTTGISTLDYFLSCEALEPPGAESDYTETLVRMQRVNSYYLPPPTPETLPVRRDLGIPDDWHVYAIPQSLFKLHPDFDPVLEQILERDPAGHIVFIADPKGTLYPRLNDRFQKRMPMVADRIHFTPRLNLQGFFGLAAIADVVLDVPQFSGGNTSYEAFAVGAPVVTRRSGFMRGRLTAALYQMMGLGELVCSDDATYVNAAVLLGTEPDERMLWRDRICEARSALYEDRIALRELEDFLLDKLESPARITLAS